MGEFNKIKTENEATAASYLHKIKGLIEEGEEHIKDIEDKIPKDLKSVKQDVKQRLLKLRFMIREYYRDHKSTSEGYEQVKMYLDKSSSVLKRIKNMKLTTDEEAEIKKLEDEKEILKMMIDKMKKEIKGTQVDFNEKQERLKKIHKLSQKNKFYLLEYYNKLEAL